VFTNRIHLLQQLTLVDSIFAIFGLRQCDILYRLAEVRGCSPEFVFLWSYRVGRFCLLWSRRVCSRCPDLWFTFLSGQMVDCYKCYINFTQTACSTTHILRVWTWVVWCKSSRNCLGLHQWQMLLSIYLP